MSGARARVVVGGAVATAGGLLVLLGGPRLAGQGAALGYLVVAAIGLHVIVVETAQPSLGHAAFMGMGAYLAAFLRRRWGLDGLTAALLCGAATAVLGWLIGRGTSRLQPAFVALSTWALGWLLFAAAGAFPSLSGGVAGVSFGSPLSLPLGLDVTLDERGHVVLAVALLLLALLLLDSARRSTIGLGGAALRDGPALAEALGYDVAALRRAALLAGAGAAGLGGALAAQLSGIVDASQYSPLVSLTLFAAVLVGARFGTLGAPVGIAVLLGVPVVVVSGGDLVGLPLGRGADLVAALTVVVALFAASRVAPRAHAAATVAAAIAPRPVWAAPATDIVGPAPVRAPAPVAAGSAALEARVLSHSYGGVRALREVSLDVVAGEVRGLVGPNGSGKSTLLRCLAGATAVDAGTVTVGGKRLDGFGQAARVRAGLARTFQRTVLLPSLDTAGHALVGSRLRAQDTAWAQALFKTPRYRAASPARLAAAAGTLELVGLAVGGPAPAELSAGRQRLLQVAAALATRPAVLMLDEPAAGMRPDELALLEAAIVNVAAAGVAVLLVEHNMAFVGHVCNRVTVLDEGRVVTTGTPAEVTANAEVRAAYLGVSASTTPTTRSRRAAPIPQAPRRSRAAGGASPAPADAPTPRPNAPPGRARR